MLCKRTSDFMKPGIAGWKRFLKDHHPRKHASLAGVDKVSNAGLSKAQTRDKPSSTSMHRPEFFEQMIAECFYQRLH